MENDVLEQEQAMWERLEEQLRIPIGNCWGPNHAQGAFNHIQWYAFSVREHAERMMEERGAELDEVWRDAVMAVEHDPACQASNTMSDTFVPLVLFRTWPEQAEALMRWWIKERGLPETVLTALKEWGEDQVDYVTFRNRYNELRAGS